MSEIEHGERSPRREREERDARDAALDAAAVAAPSSSSSSSSAHPRERGGDRGDRDRASAERRMGRGNDSKRVYVGNISHQATEDDLRQHFVKFFPTQIACNPKGFAFLEFEEERDALDAMRYMDGIEHMGRRLSVRPAGGPQPPRPYAQGPRGGDRQEGGGRRSGVAHGFRLTVENVAEKTSWQDLKDFGRRGGDSIKYADVFTTPNGKSGVISYAIKEDSENAIRVLDGADLHGNIVRVFEDRNPEPPQHEGGGGDRGGFRGGRGGGRPDFRGGFDSRGPPPPDRYDDRYASRGPYDAPRGYDDRRGGGGDYGRGYEAPRGYDDRYARGAPSYDYYRGGPPAPYGPPHGYDERPRERRRTPSPQRARSRDARSRSRSPRGGRGGNDKSQAIGASSSAAAASLGMNNGGGRSRSRSPRRRSPSPDRRRRSPDRA